MSIITVKPHHTANVDWSHNLSKGLMFANIAGGVHRADLVTGNLPSAISTSPTFQTATDLGISVHSGGFATYMAWPFEAGIINQFKGAGTVASWIAIDWSGSWGHILSIPYRSGAWSSPWTAFGFYNRSGTNQCQASKVYGSATLNTVVSSSNMFFTDKVMRLLVFTVDESGNTNFWMGNREDITQGRGLKNTGTGTVNSADFDFSSAYEILSYSRSSTSNNENLNGNIPFGAIWNRALCKDELNQLFIDPYQFIKFSSKPVFMAPAAGGPPATDPLVDEQIMMM